MRRALASACRQVLASAACIAPDSAALGPASQLIASWSDLASVGRLRQPQRQPHSSSWQHTRSLTGSGPSTAQREAIEKMIDMMVSNPSLQQMMMAALPAHMRRPEVLQAMFNNPQTRSQIADMIARQGMSLPPEVVQRLGDTEALQQSLVQAEAMGLSPQQMFSKLLQYPVLMQKFQDPRVVRAFLDIAQNPDNLAKYQDQPDIVEVYFKAKEVLLPKQDKPFSMPGPAQLEDSSATAVPSSSSSTSAAPSTAADAPAGLGAVLGIGSDELLQQLLANPKAVEALSKPKVQEALRESAGSKWKMLKYMFDPDIREAVQELQKLVDNSQKGGRK